MTLTNTGYSLSAVSLQTGLFHDCTLTICFFRCLKRLDYIGCDTMESGSSGCDLFPHAVFTQTVSTSLAASTPKVQ